MIDKTLYNENSIESLDPLQFTRLRPEVYAGDTTYSTQLLVEIISNAVDEYRLGHGNKIDVTIMNNDGHYQIAVVIQTTKHSHELRHLQCCSPVHPSNNQ